MLTENLAAFDALVESTHTATGLSEEQVIHDYWLIRGLSGIAAALPEGGVFKAVLTDKDIKKGRTVEMMPTRGVWAFGGGTSLSSAWKISPRWSEDIDAAIFQPIDSSKASFRKIRSQITDVVANALGAKGETSGSPTIAHTYFTVSDGPDLKMDHVLETLPSEQIVSSSQVTGLIARYSDEPDKLCEEFPELGGFELPVIQPAYIAVNKLDALHRRAATEQLGKLRGRVRDIYDLYHIAHLQPHADLCRENVSEWWHQMNRGGGPEVDRPKDGYGTSPIFASGSPAQEALRDAYQDRIPEIIIGEPPSFEDVIDAARTLDLP